MDDNAPTRRRRIGLWLAAMLAVGLAVGAVAYLKRPAPPPPLPTATVETADIRQVVQAAGIVQARTKVDVGAQVTGQIRQVHVQLGQHVRKGDALVSLDPELARNAVLQAEASLSQQEASLDARRVDVATARREAQRQRTLLAGEATSRAELEQAEANLAKLEAEVKGQTSQANRLRADLDNARLRLGYTRVVAPVDGDVVSIAVQEGQTVNAEQQSPTLLTLAQLDTVTIRAQVAEADVRHVRIGQEASFTTLGDATTRHVGRVRALQPLPEKQANAVFYNVLFDVPNPRRGDAADAPRTLLLDMSVQVELQVAQLAKVPSIPLAALGERDSEGRYTVYVQGADRKNEPRKVRVGAGDVGKVEVLDGVRLGEKVLLAQPPASAPAP
jgi:macrolide-specific efflux system membrane fusion protein